VQKFLTKKICFGKNLGSRSTVIFRPWVRKWSFWEQWVKGFKLIRGSVAEEGIFGCKSFLTPNDIRLMWFDQNLDSRLVNFNNYRGGGP
jgi:hypothetical protein